MPKDKDVVDIVEENVLLSKSVLTLRRQLAEVESNPALAISLEEVRKIPELKELTPAQRRFLVAYLSSNCSVRSAGIACGISMWSHYQWKSAQPKYKAAFEKCEEIFADFLEASMKNHAVNGFTVPVHYKGMRVDTFKEFNAQERIVLLKGMKPQYRDNYFPANQTGPIQISISYPTITRDDDDGAIDVTPKPKQIK